MEKAKDKSDGTRNDKDVSTEEALGTACPFPRDAGREDFFRSGTGGAAGDFALRPVGVVRSPLTRREDCPPQGFEGAPAAEIRLDPAFAEGLDGIEPGQCVIVLTWFHLARRDLLRVHPRGDATRPLRGVFATRSPARPNPIGLHRAEVLSLEGCRLRVRPLEALSGTPVLDIKPVLAASPDF